MNKIDAQEILTNLQEKGDITILNITSKGVEVNNIFIDGDGNLAIEYYESFDSDLVCKKIQDLLKSNYNIKTEDELSEFYIKFQDSLNTIRREALDNTLGSIKMYSLREGDEEFQSVLEELLKDTNLDEIRLKKEFYDYISEAFYLGSTLNEDVTATLKSRVFYN